MARFGSQRPGDQRGWYEPSKPRSVEGGLKARTARGAIGSAWWSKRFLAVLESFAMGNRLARGRTYARKGQVISLDVQRGSVKAEVQGSRVRPYKVTIGLAPFTDLVWAKAEIALTEQALPTAKLLAGEVPPELEEIFAAAGAPLFPQRRGDLEQLCSCPDSEVPCKHLAATFYLLAEAFDDDPFLILRWRGRDREPLLARLRELRGDRSAPADEPRPGTPGTALVLGDVTVPAVDPTHFWQPPPPLQPSPAHLQVGADVILRQLPVPGAAIGGPRLAEALIARYRELSGDDSTRSG